MILTLLTDFGTASPYVAILKGLALKAIPELSLIDLSHQIRPGDILESQFFLKHCCYRFPENSIHLAIVDPGVGTSRLPLAIQADDGFLSALIMVFSPFFRERLKQCMRLPTPGLSRRNRPQLSMAVIFSCRRPCGWLTDTPSTRLARHYNQVS